MSSKIALMQHDTDSVDIFGFWLYIMTDCILFASLFAVFIILHHPGAFGPSLKPLVDLKYVLGETFLLLSSNFTFGISTIASYKGRSGIVISFLMVTLLLGALFVGMEIYEFHSLVREGYSWAVSGSSSAFFVLVGTHGLHVLVGLIWIAIFVIQYIYFGGNKIMHRRMTYLGMFWNFLDIVWIFLFTIVYFMEVI
jgi:cytochrome o ubiquinol oxidase subunit 3